MTPWQMYERTLLGLTLWREARGEAYSTRIAVAHTVRNRVTHPKWWGNDYISVLTKKWQYSSMTDPKDRQLTTWPGPSDHEFEECLGIACDVMDDRIANPVKGADSYYDVSIPPPKWATEEKRVGQLGTIVFFNVDGDTDD